VYEIERKYLLDRLPVIPDRAVALDIEQGYLAASDDRGVVQGRLRRCVAPGGEVTLTHTIKHGLGLVRRESERTIAEGEFDRLWPQTRHRRLRKTRYHVTEGELVWEIDEYADFELVLAEVELPSADTEFSPTLSSCWPKSSCPRPTPSSPCRRGSARTSCGRSPARLNTTITRSRCAAPLKADR
jgi:CYTH domain-containing protein